MATATPTTPIIPAFDPKAFDAQAYADSVKGGNHTLDMLVESTHPEAHRGVSEHFESVPRNAELGHYEINYQPVKPTDNLKSHAANSEALAKAEDTKKAADPKNYKLEDDVKTQLHETGAKGHIAVDKVEGHANTKIAAADAHLAREQQHIDAAIKAKALTAEEGKAHLEALKAEQATLKAEHEVQSKLIAAERAAIHKHSGVEHIKDAATKAVEASKAGAFGRAKLAFSGEHKVKAGLGAVAAAGLGLDAARRIIGVIVPGTNPDGSEKSASGGDIFVALGEGALAYGALRFAGRDAHIGR